MCKLPKTRWAGIRDKLVNVPINDNDLLKTLSNLTKLPRGPDNGGLLPVKLKRKVEYKNFVLEAYIDPTKLINTVNVLKELGHPGYANVTINEDFAEQVKATMDNLAIDDYLALDDDLAGDNNQAIDDDLADDNLAVDNNLAANDDLAVNYNLAVDDDLAADVNEKIRNNAMESNEEDEDNVNKYHFKGKMSCILDNDCPEISLVQDCSLDCSRLVTQVQDWYFAGSYLRFSACYIDENNTIRFSEKIPIDKYNKMSTLAIYDL